MRHTKKAFIASLLSVVLCVSMLAGTTFAWFTDSVTSAGNRIISGTLKVDLVMYKDGQYTSIGGNSGDIFKEAATANNSAETLWEPGKTQVVYLGVKNNGNLALKYNLLLDIRDTDTSDEVNLADVLDFAIVDGATNETTYANWAEVQAAATTPIATIGSAMRLAAGTTTTPSFARVIAAENGKINPVGYIDGEDGADYFALAVHMQEDAGNAYQDKAIIIDVNLVATQATVEEDSFDNLYDELAEFPPIAYAMNSSAGQNFDVDAATDTVIADALAVSTIPADTSIITGDNTYEDSSNGVLTRQITSESAENEVTYNISYQYTATVTDGVTGETTSTTEDVSEFSKLIVNELNVGPELKIVKVTHTHGTEAPVLMTAFESADFNEEGYYYDHTSGILTIKSARYSEFAVLFDSKVAVKSLTVEPADSVINVYETTNLTGTVLPDEATYKTITWTSSDPEVISVDANGVVTAHKAGTVTITATADGMNESATVTSYAASHVGDSYFLSLQAAIDAAEDGDEIEVLASLTESIQIGGTFDETTREFTSKKNLTIDLNGNTLTGNKTAYTIALYNCENITIKDGSVVNAQKAFRIGEHTYTVVKWRSNDDCAQYGYHPQAPAKTITLENLNVNAGTEVFYYTNIEDDLTRADKSNPTDRDLYGTFIYRNGYTKETYQSGKYQENVVFTACTDKDSVVINGGTYTYGTALTGNMATENGERHTSALTINSGSFSDETGGRFVASGKYLVYADDSFVVSDEPAETYTAKVNNIYFNYAGGANDAILFADFGETVYIKENADVAREFGMDDTLFVVYEADGVAYTGAVPVNQYKMVEEEVGENTIKFSTKFNVVAEVYKTTNNSVTPALTEENLVGRYPTVAEAFAAANKNGQLTYVRLVDDYTGGDDSKYYYTDKARNAGAHKGSCMRFDLNGYTWTYTGTNYAISDTNSSGSSNKASYFIDSRGGGKILAPNGKCYYKENSGSENTFITGGTYISKNEPLYINKMSASGKAGRLYIQGGTFESQTKTAVCLGLTHSSGLVEISGGTYISSSSSTKDIGGWTTIPCQIKGGTFSKNPEANSTNVTIVSGKTVTDNGDGTYTVH